MPLQWGVYHTPTADAAASAAQFTEHLMQNGFNNLTGSDGEVVFKTAQLGQIPEEPFRAAYILFDRSRRREFARAIAEVQKPEQRNVMFERAILVGIGGGDAQRPVTSTEASKIANKFGLQYVEYSEGDGTQELLRQSQALLLLNKSGLLTSQQMTELGERLSMSLQKETKEKLDESQVINNVSQQNEDQINNNQLLEYQALQRQQMQVLQQMQSDRIETPQELHNNENQHQNFEQPVVQQFKLQSEPSAAASDFHFGSSIIRNVDTTDPAEIHVSDVGPRRVTFSEALERLAGGLPAELQKNEQNIIKSSQQQQQLNLNIQNNDIQLQNIDNMNQFQIVQQDEEDARPSLLLTHGSLEPAKPSPLYMFQEPEQQISQQQYQSEQSPRLDAIVNSARQEDRILTTQIAEQVLNNDSQQFMDTQSSIQIQDVTKPKVIEPQYHHNLPLKIKVKLIMNNLVKYGTINFMLNDSIEKRAAQFCLQYDIRDEATYIDLCKQIKQAAEKFGYFSSHYELEQFPALGARKPTGCVACVRFNFGLKNQVYDVIKGDEQQIALNVCADFNLDPDLYGEWIVRRLRTFTASTTSQW